MIRCFYIQGSKVFHLSRPNAEQGLDISLDLISLLNDSQKRSEQYCIKREQIHIASRVLFVYLTAVKSVNTQIECNELPLGTALAVFKVNLGG